VSKIKTVKHEREAERLARKKAKAVRRQDRHIGKPAEQPRPAAGGRRAH
jgi:hypothetical protein